MKILLVDDSIDNLRLFKLYLSKGSYQIIEAMNGREAVTKFKQELPDIVFMDLEMPEMGGLEAVAEMRKVEVATEMDPICMIAITGNSEPSILADCEKAGFSKVLIKPVSKKDFLSYLTSTLPQ